MTHMTPTLVLVHDTTYYVVANILNYRLVLSLEVFLFWIQKKVTSSNS